MNFNTEIFGEILDLLLLTLILGSLSVIYPAPEISQISDYDLIGFEHYSNQAGKNNFLFQNQDRVFDLNLGWGFWKFRPSKAVTRRFVMPDPLSSEYPIIQFMLFRKINLGWVLSWRVRNLKNF